MVYISVPMSTHCLAEQGRLNMWKCNAPEATEMPGEGPWIDSVTMKHKPLTLGHHMVLQGMQMLSRCERVHVTMEERERKKERKQGEGRRKERGRERNLPLGPGSPLNPGAPGYPFSPFSPKTPGPTTCDTEHNVITRCGSGWCCTVQ